MSDSTLSQRALAAANTSIDSRASVGASLALVVGFWWAATGLTLAMQRSSLTSTASLVVSSLLAVVGGLLIANTRTETTARSARLAFLGSALVWWWCSTIFYAGIGIRLAADIPSGPRTFPLALQAIEATLRPDLVGVAALVLIGLLVRGQPNRVSFWALFVFWATLQTAKLNVFMGVRNSGVDWLPDHLAGLSQFFGPAQNSLLLPVTNVLLTICFVVTTAIAVAATTPFRRHAFAMIAFLLGLAVVEHVFLGINLTLPLWDIFKPAR